MASNVGAMFLFLLIASLVIGIGIWRIDIIRRAVCAMERQAGALDRCADELHEIAMKLPGKDSRGRAAGISGVKDRSGTPPEMPAPRYQDFPDMK